MDRNLNPKVFPVDGHAGYFGDQRIVLRNIRWCTYCSLMEDTTDSSLPHFTYTNGSLEILMPGTEHENITDMVDDIVKFIADESEGDLLPTRSTTFRRYEIEKGFEADASYYIIHAAAMRGKKVVDLSVDPAPELIVEVDITNSSEGKLPLFAEFGVREVWWFRESGLTILHLTGDSYVPSERSLAFPILTGPVITNFMEQVETMPRKEWRRMIRDWSAQKANV